MQTWDPLINLKVSEAVPPTGWHGFTNSGFESGDWCWQLVDPLGQTAIPSWLMHTLSVRQQTIIIKEEVQIAEVPGGMRPGGYLSHESPGAVKADAEPGERLRGAV